MVIKPLKGSMQFHAVVEVANGKLAVRKHYVRVMSVSTEHSMSSQSVHWTNAASSHSEIKRQLQSSPSKLTIHPTEMAMKKRELILKRILKR